MYIYNLHVNRPIVNRFSVLIVLALGSPPGLDVLLPLLPQGVVALSVGVTLHILALAAMLQVKILALMSYSCTCSRFRFAFTSTC